MIVTRTYGPVCMFARAYTTDYAFALERVAEAEAHTYSFVGIGERRITAIRLHGRKDFMLLDMDWDKFIRLKKK